MILWLKKKQKKRKKISIKNVFHATYWIYWQTQRLTTCERVKAEATHTKNSNNNLIYLIDMMMTKFFRIYCLRHLFFPSTTCKKKLLFVMYFYFCIISPHMFLCCHSLFSLRLKNGIADSLFTLMKNITKEKMCKSCTIIIN